jgi:hypothetical protein
MANKADIRRRWIGAVFLGTATLMLVAGQTVLEGRLSRVGFLLYWAGCFLFTFLAMATALLDLAIVRRRTRREERALFEKTLEEIASEKKSRSERTSSNGGRH